MLKLATREGKKGITLDLKVTPAAKVDSFAGIQGDRFRVKVADKAVEGAANAALLKLVALTFQVPNSSVTLLSGKTGRLKTVFIAAPAGPQNDEQTAQRQLFSIAEKLANGDPGS